MKTLALILFVAACSKSPNADCEGLKAKYLAWSDAKTQEALSADTPEQRAKDEVDGAKERASADAKFIGACKEMKLDATCWVDKLDDAKKKACKPMQHELDEKLYR
ncbi:MAG: hypothetical protein ABI678_31660 [Kofleriaceae bacterium]